MHIVWDGVDGYNYTVCKKVSREKICADFTVLTVTANVLL